MTDTKFVDYDAAFAELDEHAKPLTRRLFGRTWELPGVPPAALILRLSRLVAEGRSAEDLTTGETMMLAADLVPGETLDQWLEKGLDIEQLGVILEDLIDTYGPQMGFQSEGEAPAPTTGQPQVIPDSSPKSSATGVFSKPTSNGSTDYTSPGS